MTHEQTGERPTTTVVANRQEHVPLVVVGGGLAGTFAAIAAARNGTRVVLLQERPVLGGNSSSEVRVHPVGASQHGYHRDARETGLMEELFLEVRSRAYGLRQINGRHYPMWDVILAETAEAEPNLTLHLNTRVIGVATADDARDGYATRITGLTAVQQGSEAVFHFTADAVIDATGDGFVALQAGAPFRYGREAQAEFGERWAPEEADDVVLGSTIMFAARDVGRPVPYTPPAWAHAFLDEDSLPFRNHDEFESGYWWLEWGGRLNTIADNETIRRELHAAVFGVWDHIKNHCTVPGVRERAASWTLDWIGHLPGKRESRRFEGDHILTEGDIDHGILEVPADVVAFGGWAIDLHAPDGVYSPDVPCTQPPLPDVYGIPLRSLYSRTVSNLFLAGRNISQTHVAHGSTRVMKTTAVIGEAAGTAAAAALREGVTPRGLAGDEALVTALQQQLLRQGAYLPRVGNADGGDLVRMPGVTITATSEAALTIQTGSDHIDPVWEYAGISTAESAGLAREVELNPAGRVADLAASHAQAVIVSAGRIEGVTLPLVNAGYGDITARLQVRQAVHLRDFGGLDADDGVLATVEATVPPGASDVAFVPDSPIDCEPNSPVVLVLEANAALRWALSWQEPPGTQAARWDGELGYWRWIHGTLGFALTPVSAPYAAANVASGVTRPEVGANVWISDPHQPLPQSLEVHWPEPVAIGQVELTFDSQLSGWIWEGAFPLIPKKYEIDVCDPATGAWSTVASVDDNVQRRCVHRLGTQRTDALRITIRATQGGRTARIVEVRAYGAET
ncbi:MAG TPA: FAD-dependent oxidoreductase [Thermomicrobiales bacterium]|nr:FAD-dependent oxidoreductase [Thermomicrobiales bacterium]